MREGEQGRGWPIIVKGTRGGGARGARAVYTIEHSKMVKNNIRSQDSSRNNKIICTYRVFQRELQCSEDTVRVNIPMRTKKPSCGSLIMILLANTFRVKKI